MVKKMKILIVEDSDTQGEMLKNIFAEESYSVSLAKDGGQALRRREPGREITWA